MIEVVSFDAAAERIEVTPSAVSQRTKALLRRAGLMAGAMPALMTGAEP